MKQRKEYTPLNLKSVGNIPKELRERPQWVCWRDEPGHGKVPYNASTQQKAKVNDPDTWCTFAEALHAYQNSAEVYLGIGYVFVADDPYCGIDLDDCITNGEVQPWAERIVLDLNSYTEISPSGTGLKVFCIGRNPSEHNKQNPFETGAVEIYDNVRFFTVTGEQWPGTPADIADCQPAIDRFCRLVFANKQAKPSSNGNARKPTITEEDGITDDMILARARAASKGEVFDALWRGDTSTHSGDDSAADLALCNHLAFWCGPDNGRIDGLFRQSKLFRDKWDEKHHSNGDTYGQGTVKFAIDGCRRFFDWSKHKTSEEVDTAAGVQKPIHVVGKVQIEAGAGRCTASGKVVVPIVLRVNGQGVDHLSLTDAATNRANVAKAILRHAGDGVEREAVEKLIGQILAGAAQRIEAAATVRDGLDIRVIVTERVPDAFKLSYRTARGAWSESRGLEVNRSDFITFTPAWLMDYCGTATDAPRAGDGRVNRPALIRAVEGELKVLWAEIIGKLPHESDSELSKESIAAQRLRSAIIGLWSIARTHEIPKGNDQVAVRASLVSRVKTAMQTASLERRKSTGGPKGRWRWMQVQDAFDAWWRPNIIQTPIGMRYSAWLAMRWNLTHQIGMQLPGVTDQNSLCRLGRKYGVLAAEDELATEGVPAVLSGGDTRLAVLSVNLTDELLAEPEEPPQDDTEQDGQFSECAESDFHRR